MTSIGFITPALLFALVLLPIIWWLNRLTPPRPKTEPFPPFAILLTVLKRDDTPAKSPWWLTLLRMLMAACIIIALANPIINPTEDDLDTSGPLILVLDNSWATAPDWTERQDAALTLIQSAENADQLVLVALTTQDTKDLKFTSANEAKAIIQAAKPIAAHPDRSALSDAISSLLSRQTFEQTPSAIAIISGGIANDTNDNDNYAKLLALPAKDKRLIISDKAQFVAPIKLMHLSNAIEVEAVRLKSDMQETFAMNGYDLQSRSLISGTINFAEGETKATAQISAPFELLNDVIRVAVTPIIDFETIDSNQTQPTAASSILVNDQFRRRRIGILSGDRSVDQFNPLLASNHYIRSAISPYVDIIETSNNQDIGASLEQILAQNPSAIITSNIGVMPDDITERVAQWIDDGGTLIRFAGPKLAAAENNDTLLPVQLRQGERQLGSSLSWEEPKPIADFAPNSPFFGIELSDDIRINRQILAKPDRDLSSRSWANLIDGTPLVTAKTQGQGTIILFHISAETSWSNLPLTGQFVDMLRRTISLSSSRTGNDQQDGSNINSVFLTPFKVLNTKGQLTSASGQIKPLELANTANGDLSQLVTTDNPPGLYGTQDGWEAVNLLSPNTKIMPLSFAENSGITRVPLEKDMPLSLKPIIFTSALILLMIDALIILFMSGIFSRRFVTQNITNARDLAKNSLKISLLFGAALLLNLPSTHQATAQTATLEQHQTSDADILKQLSNTRLAYVKTGDEALDRISHSGMEGLSFFLRTRTALEPGDPIGLDISKDPLAFHSIIYWPISETAPIPSRATIARIDNFMKNGGTVLFDTRDEIINLGGSVSQRTLKLREILADLNIPPLEPVPENHVLTRTFYLMNKFPGRYNDGELWVQALPRDGDENAAQTISGDGVSPILITSNDFAAAWARNDQGQYLFPTVPDQQRQRILAYRSGVNIMIYMLTGNYKADQVHIPDLLERLGQ